MKRAQTNPETPAIAFAPETPHASVGPQDDPAVLVTLMLTTGSRYSFRIDSKYLKRRNIGSQEDKKDPWDISVYTMKELLWRDWRDGMFLKSLFGGMYKLIRCKDWEQRPTSPSYIRLIHLGRMLDDKTLLQGKRATHRFIIQHNLTDILVDCRFNRTTPNVVHMTVRPSEVDDDDGKMGKSSHRHDRDDGTGRTGCRCCSVM